MTIAPIVMSWLEADVIDPSDGSIERRHVMVPVQKYRNRAEQQYEDAAEYPLMPVEARSRAQHSRYFAALKEAFDSIPETVSARWDNVEHFRKWVLIEIGWYTEKEFTFEGRHAEKEALALGAFIRTGDEYARVWVSCVEQGENDFEGMITEAVTSWTEHEDADSLADRMRHALRAAWRFLDRSRSKTAKWKVLVRKAKSQDHASMKKGDFRASSDEVLDYASGLIGTRRTELQRNAGRSS